MTHNLLCFKELPGQSLVSLLGAVSLKMFLLKRADCHVYAIVVAAKGTRPLVSFPLQPLVSCALAEGEPNTEEATALQESVQPGAAAHRWPIATTVQSHFSLT